MVVGDVFSCLRLNLDRGTAFLSRDGERQRVKLPDPISSDMWMDLNEEAQLRIYEAPDSIIGVIWKATWYPAEDGQPLMYSGEDVSVEVI